MKFSKPFEAHIYIGSRRSYNGENFGLQELKYAIRDFQEGIGKEKACPVRITETSYQFGKYFERGWEISIINYPRFPKTEEELYKFAYGLGEYLFDRFEQNRLTVCLQDKTMMFEKEDAEESHEPASTPEKEQE